MTNSWSDLGRFASMPNLGNIEMKFHILTTNDSSLVGAISELIALQYIWQKGIHAYSFAAGCRRNMFNKLVAETQPNL